MLEIFNELDYAGLEPRFFRYTPGVQQEIWRPVPSDPSRLLVSHTGEVWSRRKRKGHGGYLKQSVGGPGYPQVGLDSGGVRVHRLVAEAFEGPIPKGSHVCHYDGDKTNNHFGNLRIDTPRGNGRDTPFQKDRSNVRTTEPYYPVHVGLFDLETDRLVHSFGPICPVIAEIRVGGGPDIIRRAQAAIDRWRKGSAT